MSVLRRRGVIGAGGGDPAPPAPTPGSVTTNSVTSAGSISVNRPAGVEEGDRLVVSIHTRGAFTDAQPAGFDLVDRSRTGSTTTSAATSVYSKVATDDEPASYTFGLESSRPASIVCLAVSDVGDIGDTAGSFGTDGSGVAPSPGDGLAGALLYVCWGGRSMLWNDPAVPAGMTEHAQLVGLSNEPHQLVGTEPLDEDGPVGTRTSDVDSGGHYAHVAVVLLPPGVGGA